MKKRTILFFSMMLISVLNYSQCRFTMNQSVYVVIKDSANVVIDNTNPNAITTLGSVGGIITEAEFNVVKWNIGTGTGNYVIPFTTSGLVNIPLAVNVTVAGNGAGNIRFSTYETSTDVNTPYPSDVSNMNSGCSNNNALYAVDRFWRIDAGNYITKPTPVIDFTYNSAINEIGGANTITESRLKAERFNSGLASWQTPAKLYGIGNSFTHHVSGVAVSPADFHKSWTLIDTVSMTIAISATTSNSMLCAGNTATLTPAGAYTYTLNPGGLSGTVFTVSPSSSITYTISGTNANGCSTGTSGDAIITVSVNANPTITVNNATICPGASATLTAGGATNYTWSPGAMTGSNTTVSPASTTIYTVTGENANGCIATNTVEIFVSGTPTITTSGDATVCPGVSTTLTANGAVSYTWNPSASLNSGTGSSVVSSPGLSTTYTVTGANSNGCTSASSVVVTVAPNPTLTASANVTVCPLAAATLSVSGANTYTWSPNVFLNNNTSASVISTPSASVTYTIDGASALGCVGSTTLSVMVHTIPVVTVTVSTPGICPQGSSTLFASGASTYTWSPALTLSSDSGASVIAHPQASTIYTVTGSNGLCSTTTTVEIIVHPLPVIDAGQDTTINMDEYITLHGTGNVPVGFYPTYGNELNCNFCPSIVVHPQEHTCYILKGINQYGCVKSDTVCVDITQNWEVFFPNAFTPDGNGNNDTFIPVGYAIKEIKLEIYDRWGAQIFRSDDTHAGWDGTFKGKLCEQGVYIFKAEVTSLVNTKVYKTGHVTLLSRVD